MPPDPLATARVLPLAGEDRCELSLGEGRSVEVRRVRDRRARRIKLLVSERGVRLTLPLRASLREAQAFLESQRDWVAAQLARLTPSAQALPAFGPEACTWLPLRGGRLPVAWREGRYTRIHAGADAVAVQCPPGVPAHALSRALREFYLAEARRDLGLWLPCYLAGLPRPPSGFRIRPLSSLWGSLSPGGAVSLDLALVLGRPSAYEYVLVHELCHLLQPNHSRAFWREVEARFGEWRGERDYLRNEGPGLKAALRQVCGLP